MIMTYIKVLPAIAARLHVLNNTILGKRVYAVLLQLGMDILLLEVVVILRESSTDLGLFSVAAILEVLLIALLLVVLKVALLQPCLLTLDHLLVQSWAFVVVVGLCESWLVLTVSSSCSRWVVDTANRHLSSSVLTDSEF